MDLPPVMTLTLTGQNNATYIGTLFLRNWSSVLAPEPPLLPVRDHYGPTVHQSSSYSKGGHDRYYRRVDPTGATYYVIAVVLVYGMSIVLLIASRINRKNAKALEDRQINKYLQEFQVVREKSSREKYRNLKRDITAKLRGDKQQNIPTYKSLTKLSLLPLTGLTLPTIKENQLTKLDEERMNQRRRSRQLASPRCSINGIAWRHDDKLVTVENELIHPYLLPPSRPSPSFPSSKPHGILRSTLSAETNGGRHGSTTSTHVLGHDEAVALDGGNSAAAGRRFLKVEDCRLGDSGRVSCFRRLSCPYLQSGGKSGEGGEGGGGGGVAAGAGPGVTQQQQNEQPQQQQQTQQYEKNKKELGILGRTLSIRGATAAVRWQSEETRVYRQRLGSCSSASNIDDSCGGGGGGGGVGGGGEGGGVGGESHDTEEEEFHASCARRESSSSERNTSTTTTVRRPSVTSTTTVRRPSVTSTTAAAVRRPSVTSTTTLRRPSVTYLHVFSPKAEHKVFLPSSASCILPPSSSSFHPRSSSFSLHPVPSSPSIDAPPFSSSLHPLPPSSSHNYKQSSSSSHLSPSFLSPGAQNATITNTPSYCTLTYLSPHPSPVTQSFSTQLTPALPLGSARSRTNSLNAIERHDIPKVVQPGSLDDASSEVRYDAMTLDVTSDGIMRHVLCDDSCTLIDARGREGDRKTEGEGEGEVVGEGEGEEEDVGFTVALTLTVPTVYAEVHHG